MKFENLVSKGYFPEELPPSFHTQGLAIHLAKIMNLIDADLSLQRKISTPISFSIPKIKNYRRHLSVPNPLNYLLIAQHIFYNWRRVSEHCQKSKISVARLEYNSKSSRAIDKPHFENYIKDRIIRSTGCRYILKVDIAKCYDSIQVDTFTDALKVGAQRSDFAKITSIGKKIATLIKKSQGGHTVGLPIGPDSSRIISEVILTSVDLLISDALKGLNGIRVVDDYYLYFNSIGETEIASARIQQVLKQYDLELNQVKEKVFQLPEIIDPEWLYDIREFNFRDKPLSQRRDLVVFFDKAISYANKYPEDFVLSYSVAKLSATVFKKENWDLLQSLLLNCLIIESKIVNVVAGIIISYNKLEIPFNSSIIQVGLENFLLNHLALGNDYEVCWALWIFRQLELVIPEKVIKNLQESKSPFIILTALDIYHANLAPNMDIHQWNKLCTPKNLYNEYWILAYEAILKKWVKATDNYLLKDPFFSELYKQQISFFDISRIDDLLKNNNVVSDGYGYAHIGGIQNEY